MGCPSEKVAGAGCFGAVLMLSPDLVGRLCEAISKKYFLDMGNTYYALLCVGAGSGCEVTVKCRIGVNNNDSYEYLREFIRIVSDKGKVRHFIIHARKAIIDANFSPDDNRKIPPLKYDYVYRLLKDFPDLRFTINGGVNSIEDVRFHLKEGVHGVMVGRSVINTPFLWRNVDSKVYKVKDPGLLS